MAQIEKKTIKKLTQLCRIDCTEDEQESLFKDLEKILAYIEQLQEVNTDDVAPCYQVLEEVTNVYRDDVVGQVLNRDAFLANAPSHIAGMIRVPPVIKQT